MKEAELFFVLFYFEKHTESGSVGCKGPLEVSNLTYSKKDYQVSCGFV